MQKVGKSAYVAIMTEMTGKVDKVMRGVALEAQAKIMKRTPVDTGRARANWNTTVGDPDTSVRMDASKGDVGPKKKEGEAVIRATKFSEGERVFIANGLPYVEFLEHGSSKQAPSGMVSVTMAELKPTLDSLAALVKKS